MSQLKKKEKKILKSHDVNIVFIFFILLLTYYQFALAMAPVSWH